MPCNSLLMNIEALLKDPVGILGSGLSGQAVAGLLKRLGVEYNIYSEGVADQSFNLGIAAKHQLVVYSPGFSQDHDWLKIAKTQRCVCLGELDFASIFWKGEIIAITGTNGKTTLTTFLTAAFNGNNMPAISAGNIGVPLSSICHVPEHDGKIAVCEVSSFQSEDLHYFKPSAVLWTNFAEDHLIRHKTIKEYFRAKWNLVHSAGTVYIGDSVRDFALKYGYDLPKKVKTVFLQENDLPSKGVLTRYPFSENYSFAATYWKNRGASMSTMEEIAQEFELPPHRLQWVDQVDGINYWNDSKATNFLATESALKSFEKKVIWIGGGQSKGGDIELFANNIAPYIRIAILIGDTACYLKKLLCDKDVECLVFWNMKSAVRYAQEHCGSGDNVLLSPGFSSFDWYVNYADRGKVYESEVLGLKNDYNPSIS